MKKTLNPNDIVIIKEDSTMIEANLSNENGVVVSNNGSFIEVLITSGQKIGSRVTLMANNLING